MMIRKKICAVLLAGTLLVAGCLDDGPVPQDRETRNQDEAASLYSPPFLVIDQDRDGPDLIPLESSRAYFDVDGDGVKEHMGWIREDDLFLMSAMLKEDLSIKNYDDRLRAFSMGGYKEIRPNDLNNDNFYDMDDAVSVRKNYKILPLKLDYIKFYSDADGVKSGGRDICKFKAIKLPEYKEEKIVLGHKILSEGTLVCEEGSYPLIEVRFRYEKSGDKHEHE